MRSTTPRTRSSRRRGAAVLLILALVGLAVPASSALAGAAGSPARATRSGASVQQLRAEVEAAQGARAQAEQALVDLLVRRIGLAAAATELSAADQELADQAEATRQNARELAVAAYIGGSPSPIQFLLDADQAGDVTYRQGLVADRMLDTRELEESTLRDLREVRTLVLDLADRRGRVEHSLGVANEELHLARQLEQEALDRLERAEALAAAAVIPEVDPLTRGVGGPASL